MATAGFLDLPRELRDEIYQLDIPGYPRIAHTDTHGTVTFTPKGRFSTLCRQTRAEYEEELQKHVAAFPLHHVTLDRFHARRLKTPSLPPTAEELYLVVNIHLNTPSSGKPAHPQSDRVLRDHLGKHTAKIRAALRKVPHLKRYVLECNIYELPCRCSRVLSKWRIIQVLEFAFFKVLTSCGLVGELTPRWATHWNSRSLCQNCHLRRDELQGKMCRVEKASEEAVMTKEGWGVWNYKILTSGSLRRFHRDRVWRSSRLRYDRSPMNTISFSRIDLRNRDHEEWVYLLEELKVPYKPADETDAMMQHEEVDWRVAANSDSTRDRVALLVLAGAHVLLFFVIIDVVIVEGIWRIRSGDFTLGN